MQVFCNDNGWKLDSNFYEKEVKVRVPVGTVLPEQFVQQYVDLEPKPETIS